MDFYQRQAAARRQSRWLIGALILAICVVIAALDLVVLALLGMSEDEGVQLTPGDRAGVLAFSSLLWLAIILGASAFKSLTLRGGGGVVARSLGGVRIERSTADPLRRRLLNVVEEMSIASGVAVPEVYVLENESGINAFAAGDTPANAAVAVTDGSLQRLNREQLQGVIAHEYSHILNGDMRLNLRLMGWLFGLLVIGLAGRTILRILPRGRNGKGAAPIAALAIAMLVLGYLGLFFGRLIQAALSRHRERLADASAVQFTRNPEGLKVALLKIAGLPEQGKLLANDGEQVAHMLFAAGMQRLFATHPPLGERITALDPSFDTKSLVAMAATALREGPGIVEPSGRAGLTADTVVTIAPAAVSAQVGNPQDEHVSHARALRRELRDVLARARSSWTEARLAMLTLLLSHDPQVRASQTALIESSVEPGVAASLAEYAAAFADLPAMLRLPAVSVLFASLRSAPQAARLQLLELTRQLIAADGRTDVFEFCLGELLSASLRDQLTGRGIVGNRTLADCSDELAMLFTVLARNGAASESDVARAYEAGMSRLLPRHRPPLASGASWTVGMSAALERLTMLKPAAKEMLVEALVVTIGHDGKLTVGESELLRTVCARLHCPLPPILPGVSERGTA